VTGRILSKSSAPDLTHLVDHHQGYLYLCAMNCLCKRHRQDDSPGHGCAFSPTARALGHALASPLRRAACWIEKRKCELGRLVVWRLLHTRLRRAWPPAAEAGKVHD
jgi:hypothetical protein